MVKFISGLVVADNNIDHWSIATVEGKPVIAEPKTYVVVCSEMNFWKNGGVDCHAAFHYDSLGRGFAMANTGDEVFLQRSDGTAIDRVTYGENFAVVGAALGLNPNYTSPIDNNDTSNWCPQWSLLPFGDSATPGRANDACR